MRSRRRGRRLARSRRVASSEPGSAGCESRSVTAVPRSASITSDGLHLLEAACTDRAAPRLPSSPGRAHRLVVGVRLFDRPALFVAAVAHDCPRVGPRPEVHGPVPIDPDGRRSLLGRDVGQPRVDADHGATRSQHIDRVARGRSSDGLDPGAGHLGIGLVTGDDADVVAIVSDLFGQLGPAFGGPAFRAVALGHEEDGVANFRSCPRREERDRL